ncbi:protein-methionine-sulfoxide reductase catalytic subunit MsrP [Mesorhizobium sp. IMUNJ 23232]|uniref:protein-methionine-sulfoxide reductase catalytic subunit MsrP n=1 Tax=Mesorhizobium sp. IMUNJ 23232 TaxID=3376064 RepID=UPI00378F486A
MVFSIRSRPSWAIPEALATPETAFVDRRTLLAGMGLGLAGATLGLSRKARAEDADPTADLYPAKKNEAFKLDRDLTPEDVNAHYNNFYEYGTQKGIAEAAQALKTRPWDIEIGGLVEKPFTIGFDELVRKIPLETRLYRHRCVEAWSMTIPWAGFPLNKLVALAKPQASAKYIRFETFLDPEMAPGQNDFLYPWPYIEGVTVEEAANDLAFVVTGAYDKPVAKQHGAPIRLALPWKYGFKSIKSIRKFDFVEEQPVGLWEAIQPQEYGFWANVNPEVPHPRWSQAMERVLHSGDFVLTQIYNGYGAEVASLYANLGNERLFM